MRLYQFKKPAGSTTVYFTTWGVHSNLVKADHSLKKDYRHDWFVAKGKWRRDTPGTDANVEVRNTFNEDSMCLFISFFFFSIDLSSHLELFRDLVDIF